MEKMIKLIPGLYARVAIIIEDLTFRTKTRFRP